MKKTLPECVCFLQAVFRTLSPKPMSLLLILCLNAFQIQADTVVKESISLNVEDVPLKEVFREIEQKTKYRFFYSTKVVNENRKVSVALSDASIETVLATLLDNSRIVFSIRGDQILLKSARMNRSNSSGALPDEAVTDSETGLASESRKAMTFHGFQFSVAGKVTSLAGEPLPGVNVLQKGTTNGTTTDAEGRYSLAIPDQNATLVFSFIGYTSQEVVINGRTVIDITLSEDVQSLEEIVVVGYGEQKKVNVTGSVSTLDAKELNVAPMPSITQSLMGRTSGIFIKNGNGQPGENKVDYNIRGFGRALIIIDGYPASDNDFNQLDPNDIENVSILKDAASAAVYGARAGNGVILVTTRRGATTETKVTYNANYALQYFTVVPDFISSEQYARMENMSRYNEGLPPIWTPEDIQKFADGSDPNKYPNVDWWDETLRKYAPQVQHNINVRGGSDRIKYFVSGGYFSQEGMERSGDTKSKRYNLRSNLDVAITDKLDMGINLSILNQDYIGPIRQLERIGNRFGTMGSIFRARPYFPRAFPDPTKLPGLEQAPPVNTEIDYVGYKSWNRLTGDAKVNFGYKLPFGLKARANFHFYRMYQNNKERARKTPLYNYNWDTDVYTLIGYTDDPSSLYERRYMENNLDQQYFLTWDKTFGDHTINALLVHEVLSNDFDWIDASRIRYDFDIDYLFAGPDLDKNNNGRAGEGGRKGWVGRITYDYKGKYLLELNGRRDASPKFPKDTRWGFFPSASAGWRMSEEPFIADNFSFVDNLKLRVSYGQLGYDDIGNFQYLQTYSVTSQYIYDGATNALSKGIMADALANPTITWEKMTTTNVGIDFMFFNNMLEGSFDYFYRRRSDVLGTRLQSIPNVVGAVMPQVNYAEYDNRGVELTLNHNHQIGEVQYSIGGNISWNREKALVVDQTEFASDEARRRGNRVGEWTDVVWGHRTAGLFQTKEEIETWADQDGRNNATILPGDVKIIDYNGDGKITAEDQVIIGRGVNPKLAYGINMSVGWKGFNFSMLWQGAGLFDINLRNSPDLTLPFYAGNTPTTALFRDSYVPVTDPENQWLPPNTTNARWPRYRSDNYNRGHASSWAFNDFWLISGSYIRLKTIELGYTLPQALTQRVGIETCKFYVSGYNLLTFSELDFLDPEADTSPARQFGLYYPPVGTYNVGVLLQF